MSINTLNNGGIEGTCCYCLSLALQFLAFLATGNPGSQQTPQPTTPTPFTLLSTGSKRTLFTIPAIFVRPYGLMK